MNSKKLLALLLAATLLTGSLCGPVFAARAGQTAGAESLEEIPPETIFTEKTDASAEGEAAGEYSTALETASEEPAGTADPEAPDASMDQSVDQSMDQSSEQIEENGLEAFSDGADLLEEPGDPAQQAEDNALEAPSEETDPAEDSGDPAQQAEDVVVEEPSEETDLTEDSEDPAQQPEDGIVEEPSEEADLPEDSEDPAQQPEDFAVEEPSEETDLAEDTEDPAQTAEDAAEAPSEETDAVEEPARQPEDDAADVPSEETEPAEDPGDSTQQAGEDAGQDLPAEDGTEVLPEDGLIEDQDQAEIAEEEAMAGILEGETALADQILQDDMTIDGDAYLSSGIVDLNGHTLTINGSLVQPGGAMQINGGYLEVTGDYRIQNRNDAGDYSYGGGVLVMTNENDYVKVGGELYVSGFYDFRDRNNVYVENTLTAGTLEIGAGLHQNGRREAFRAQGAHRTLITGAGAGQQASVSFDSPDSWMGILEAGDGASIDWEGYFNVQKLGSDVQIHTPAEEGGGISVYSNNGRMDFGGHTLTVDGNVKTVVGKLYVGGADLAGEGFDPE
ncbi:hypothetical protein SAMN04487833_10821, partial [Sarcina sp. DSM 11001]